MDLLDIASEQEQKVTSILLASNSAKVNNMHRSNSTGFCTDCGEPIPKKRLEVIPGASRCVNCQMIFEKEEE